MKTTIDIPEPLYRKAKIRAIETGRTLRELVLQALERDFESAIPPTAPKPGSRWANRKLRPEFKRLMESGALKPKESTRSIDDIISDIKEDPKL